MIKTVFTILLCVHLLGDFYFQTQRMADRKREKFSWTHLPQLCLFGVFPASVFPFSSGDEAEVYAGLCPGSCLYRYL